MGADLYLLAREIKVSPGIHLEIEQSTKFEKGSIIAGVDEAGRGPLAGPVVAAAVILDSKQPIVGLLDSKQLKVKKRECLAGQIQERAQAWALGRAEVDEIDRINILQASLLAMERAIATLNISPDLVLVDGLYCPQSAYPTQVIVKGDQQIAAISAASILAKVSRDAEMSQLDDLYPGYGFSQHKGYATAQHLHALRLHGITPIHRRSFAPVRAAIES